MLLAALLALPADFAPSTAAGQLGHAQADMLLGCLEVAMENYLEELTAEEAGGDGGCSACVCAAALSATLPRPVVAAPAPNPAPHLMPAAATADGAGGTAASEGELGASLLRLFTVHERLAKIVAESVKAAKGKKGEGVTQAAGGARRGPGWPPANAAAASNQPPPIVLVDKRVPAFSIGCLAKLLDAIADSGFQLPEARASEEGLLGCLPCLQCSLSSVERRWF